MVALQAICIFVFLSFFTAYANTIDKAEGEDHIPWCIFTPANFRTKCSHNNPCAPNDLLMCFLGTCCARGIVSAIKLASLDIRCEDVTIIGGGVGGTYSAWRLRDKDLKIGLYESTDRVGGKLYTRQFKGAPDINLELGGMRIKSKTHLRMMKACQDLGLKLKVFPEGMGIPERTLYYLRERHLKASDLGGLKTPYFLRKNEYLSPTLLRKYLSTSLLNYANSSNDLYDLFRVTTRYDGVPLYKQSYDQAALKQVSLEACNYLKDVTGSHSFYGNVQASDKLPYSENVKEEILTIASGMNSLPMAFLKEYLHSSNKHKFTSNRKLYKIRKNAFGYYDLYFKKTQTFKGNTIETDETTQICSRKVILALPKTLLEKVDWHCLRKWEVSRKVNSVMDAEASKVFLLYDQAWWRHLPLNYTHVVTDKPTRQSYDFGVSRTGRGVLLASYVDGTGAAYWRQLQIRGQSGNHYHDRNVVSEYVVKQVHMYLAKIYNTNHIPQPVDGIMQTWDSDTYSGGWGVWQPDYNWCETKRALTQPCDEDDIYYVHGYYGTEYNGWAESSLQAGDMVLMKFGVYPYVKPESWIKRNAYANDQDKMF